MKNSLLIFCAASLLLFPGCMETKNMDAQGVVIGYDQINNFYRFEFNEPYTWGRVIYGGTNLSVTPASSGLWATFVICDIKNTGTAPQDFPFDIHKFYIEYGEKRYYYKDLELYTYSSLAGTVSNGGTHDQITSLFRTATQRGPEKAVFKAGTFTPTVNYRFAIYVQYTGPKIPNDHMFKLYYDGYPAFCTSRNQDVAFIDPATERNLRTDCRPPAK